MTTWTTEKGAAIEVKNDGGIVRVIANGAQFDFSRIDAPYHGDAIIWFSGRGAKIPFNLVSDVKATIAAAAKSRKANQAAAEAASYGSSEWVARQMNKSNSAL